MESDGPTPPPGGSLLGPQDHPVYEVVNPDGKASLLLICDHASRAVPAAMHALGMESAEFEKHIAWDIGAAAVTRHLSGLLDAPAVLAGYSRLVIDLNRQPGDPGSIPEVSDGITIPGNLHLSEAAADGRLETFFWPYHHTITRVLSHLWRRADRPPALFSVHSFTPQMGSTGEDRPWHAGVLWNRDPRLAVPLMVNLETLGDVVIGDNEPYSGREIAYTIDRHAGAAGLPNCAIEIRQDQIDDDDKARQWAHRLADALGPILAEPGLYQVEHF